MIFGHIIISYAWPKLPVNLDLLRLTGGFYPMEMVLCCIFEKATSIEACIAGRGSLTSVLVSLVAMNS
jgi:hypothetical protein